MQELHELRAVRSGPWLLNGDFNLIYCAQDKNNNRLNRHLMGQFRRFLNEAELDEIHLTGRLYTWSNERSHPTLEKIDRFFVSADGASCFHTAICSPFPPSALIMLPYCCTRMPHSTIRNVFTSSPYGPVSLASLMWCGALGTARSMGRIRARGWTGCCVTQPER